MKRKHRIGSVYGTSFIRQFAMLDHVAANLRSSFDGKALTKTLKAMAAMEVEDAEHWTFTVDIDGAPEPFELWVGTDEPFEEAIDFAVYFQTDSKAARDALSATLEAQSVWVDEIFEARLTLQTLPLFLATLGGGLQSGFDKKQIDTVMKSLRRKTFPGFARFDFDVRHAGGTDRFALYVNAEAEYQTASRKSSVKELEVLLLPGSETLKALFEKGVAAYQVARRKAAAASPEPAGELVLCKHMTVTRALVMARELLARVSSGVDDAELVASLRALHDELGPDSEVGAHSANRQTVAGKVGRSKADFELFLEAWKTKRDTRFSVSIGSPSKAAKTLAEDVVEQGKARFRQAASYAGIDAYGLAFTLRRLAETNGLSVDGMEVETLAEHIVDMAFGDFGAWRFESSVNNGPNGDLLLDTHVPAPQGRKAHDPVTFVAHWHCESQHQVVRVRKAYGQVADAAKKAATRATRATKATKATKDERSAKPGKVGGATKTSATKKGATKGGATKKASATKGALPTVDKSFLFTGTLASMKRAEAKARLEELGGVAAKSVNKDLDYLVVGDKGSPLYGDGKRGTKLVAADKLVADGASLRIISESDFLKMKRK